MKLNNNPFYLFSIPIYNLTIQQGQCETQINFTLTNPKDIQTILARQNFTTLGLGHGYQCGYCSNYNPVGTSVCMRCGGSMRILEYVKPEKLDLHLIERIYSASFESDENEFTFVTFGDGLYRAIRSGIYYAENFELGYYMCEFCGSVIREGDDCRNCGGVRLPFTELVRLDHRCLYCGSKVKGNLWCNSCGASISGTKFFGGGKF